MKILTSSVWSRYSPTYPSLPEYMKIFPEHGRIVSAAAIREEPVRYTPIAVYYEEIGLGSIRTRMRASEGWYETTFRLEGNTIYWLHVGREWPWQLISDDDLPEWFPDFEAKARCRMDDENTKSKKKPNKSEMATPRKPSDQV